jgi:hypothetical protein
MEYVYTVISHHWDETCIQAHESYRDEQKAAEAASKINDELNDQGDMQRCAYVIRTILN